MEFKRIDSLSITECCEQLDIRREDLPEALRSFNQPTERDQLLVTRLESLLNEDKSAFESCGTIEQYESYLSTWSDGIYHDFAMKKIAQMRTEAEELTFYQNNKDSISGCETYLQKYPSGKYVTEVQSALDKMKKSRTISKVKISSVAIVIVAIVIVLIIHNQPQTIEENPPLVHKSEENDRNFK